MVSPSTQTGAKEEREHGEKRKQCCHLFYKRTLRLTSETMLQRQCFSACGNQDLKLFLNTLPMKLHCSFSSGTSQANLSCKQPTSILLTAGVFLCTKLHRM